MTNPKRTELNIFVLIIKIKTIFYVRGPLILKIERLRETF